MFCFSSRFLAQVPFQDLCLQLTQEAIPAFIRPVCFEVQVLCYSLKPLDLYLQ